MSARGQAVFSEPLAPGFEPAGPRSSTPSQPQPVSSVTRISQQEVKWVPGIGNARISAHEDIGEKPRLIFSDAESGRELLTVFMGGCLWTSRENVEVNPKLRLRILSIKGLPSSLIVGIAMNPGGSDSGWEGVAVGVVHGELQELTYEHLETSNEGGFFFGDLGHGIGLGAAQWDFVWGEYEGHPPPHHYEIRLYKLNGWRFEWYRVFRTRSKYNSGGAALRAYGLPYVDIRKSFSEWADIETW